MRERIIERYLVKQVKLAGGEAKKLYGRNDPDRLVLFPGAAMCFVETKPTDGKPRPGQLREHARLWKMGFPVAILDSKELVDSFVQRFSKRSKANGHFNESAPDTEGKSDG